MKKILSLLLAAVLVLSLAACGGNTEPTTEPTDAPTSAPTTEPTQAPTTEPTEAPTTEPSEPAVTDSALVSFYMSVMENYEPVVYMYMSDNEDGTVYVEYTGEFRKQSFAFDAAALTELANALANVDLTTLGEGAYEGEMTTSCSLYVAYADGTMVMYDYAGDAVPAAFEAVLAVLEPAFQAAIADLEVYVPQLQIMGEMDADVQTELLEIMNNSGIGNLDSLAAQAITLDEYFGFSAGLTSAEGITAAAFCAPMMNASAYQLVIVTLEDEANAANVAADFEANLDFGKWVCVRPDTAMIAQKGNMVLCLMGAGSMYTGTAAAIENAGWTVVKTVADPGM